MINPASVDCILFDCDGVLMDSEIIAAQVESEVFTRIGYPISPSEIVRRFTGLTGPQVFDAIGAALGKPLGQDIRDEVDREVNRRLRSNVRMIAGTDRLIAALEKPMAVCSNSSAERLEVSIRRIGLYDHFAPHIYSALTLPDIRPKPAPDVYLHAARMLGAEPARTVVLEDSDHGIASAKAAGMMAIGFLGASHILPGHGGILTDAGADFIANDMVEVGSLMELTL